MVTAAPYPFLLCRSHQLLAKAQATHTFVQPQNFHMQPTPIGSTQQTADQRVIGRAQHYRQRLVIIVGRVQEIVCVQSLPDLANIFRVGSFFETDRIGGLQFASPVF